MPLRVMLNRDSSGKAVIQLNRPQRMNAVNLELIYEFLGQINSLSNDKSVRVVILEGTGRNFCSGADLEMLQETEGTAGYLEILEGAKKIILSLRALPQPIISKVCGVAYGFGANLTLASDFVIASEDSRFFQVFVNLGAIPDGGGHFFLANILGLAKARELLMLGQEISGRQAEEIGLIYKCCQGQDLDGEVAKLAVKLSSKSALALALVKRGLDRCVTMGLEHVLDWEAGYQTIALTSPEHKEFLGQLLGKRNSDLGTPQPQNDLPAGSVQGLLRTARPKTKLENAFGLAESPLSPRRKDRRGRKAKDDRLIFNGGLWSMKIGSTWRDLPSVFGPWQMVYRRFQQWAKSGIWEKFSKNSPKMAILKRS